MSTEMGPGPTGRTAERYADGTWLVWVSPGEPVKGLAEADARLLVYGSIYGGASDEGAGRAWCEANGKRPDHSRAGLNPPGAGPLWVWYDEDTLGTGDRSSLPRTLARLIPGDPFRSEAEACAAVGAALKSLAAVLTGTGVRDGD